MAKDDRFRLANRGTEVVSRILLVSNDSFRLLSIYQCTGRTASIKGNGVFSELIVLEDENVSATIQICAAADDTVIAEAEFDVAKISRSYTQTLAVDTAAGPNIALHVTKQTNSKLKFILRGYNLPNTDFGILFKRGNKTDPFYELFNHLGKKILRSKKVEDSLDPVWDAQYFDLESLCGNSMTVPLRVTVHDKDSGGETEYLGSLMITVQQMIDGIPIPLLKGGAPVPEKSKLSAQAELLPDETVSKSVKTKLNTALTALGGLEQLEEVAQSSQAAAEASQTKADESKKLADECSSKAELLAATQQAITTKFSDLAQKASVVSKKAEISNIDGTLNLSLAAKGLADLDFGIRNKSDPLYVASVKGKSLVRSNHVSDSLNPVWDATSVDLSHVDSLDALMKIEVLDNDKGGTADTPLGFVEKSINELLKVDPNDGIRLDDQPKRAKGQLFVKKAELVNFSNLKEKAAKLKAECDALKSELDEATKRFRVAEEEANKAREIAATDAEAAQVAMQTFKAAEEAVKMAKEEM